ncbi:MAG: PfkB family carbohydrate kinase [Chloroflexota bacterium]
MLTDPPRAEWPPLPLDLLVVGSLTIDRFADGSLAAGGSVLHATKAAVDAGYRVGVVTNAGRESTAEAGMRLLDGLVALHVAPASATLTFRHEETEAGRRLWLEVPAVPLAMPPRERPPRAVLYAPVADEIGPELGGQVYDGVARGAILQGWLRDLAPGELVRSRSISALAPPLVARLAQCDVLIASREDLLADAADPGAQLDALRATIGEGPTLIVTDADHGAWVDQAGSRMLVGVPRVVRDVPMVGAGDAYAALLLGAMGRGRDALGAARDAAAGVAEMLAARSDRRIVVLGDVHGMDRRLAGLLREAQLIDAEGSWIGHRDELWCLGDLVDRGTGGSKVIQLLRRLAAEADAAGGRVGSVLGNHEVLMLAARAMPDEPSSGPFATFRGDWIGNGGVTEDLDRVTDDDAAWLAGLPAMMRIADALLVHADAGLYLSLGRTLGEANERMAALMAEPDPVTWDGLLGVMTERFSLRDDETLAGRMLVRFGGGRVLHGHTPIARFTGADPATVRAPYVYAEGRAAALDPGLPIGGPGFLHLL